MWRSAVTFLGTILVLVALAVLPLLTPPFVHAGTDLAGSAGALGMDAATARGLSDRSVSELVLGPGSFDFPGPDGTPFYDAAERGHLRDARALLWLCLLAGAVSAAIILVLLWTSRAGRAVVWRAVSNAGAVTAIGVTIIGVLGLVAFDSLFTLFHRVFFPGGGWSFDPATQRLVQLYPFAFWQVAAAALGLLLLVLGGLAWWLGRRMASTDHARPTTDRVER
jgi:integral membrane protein (TIGR01906 family)